jgi:hypothetical protein
VFGYAQHDDVRIGILRRVESTQRVAGYVKGVRMVGKIVPYLIKIIAGNQRHFVLQKHAVILQINAPGTGD